MPVPSLAGRFPACLLAVRAARGQPDRIEKHPPPGSPKDRARACDELERQFPMRLVRRDISGVPEGAFRRLSGVLAPAMPALGGEVLESGAEPVSFTDGVLATSAGFSEGCRRWRDRGLEGGWGTTPLSGRRTSPREPSALGRSQRAMARRRGGHPGSSWMPSSCLSGQQSVS